MIINKIEVSKSIKWNSTLRKKTSLFLLQAADENVFFLPRFSLRLLIVNK